MAKALQLRYIEMEKVFKQHLVDEIEHKQKECMLLTHDRDELSTSLVTRTTENDLLAKEREDLSKALVARTTENDNLSKALNLRTAELAVQRVTHNGLSQALLTTTTELETIKTELKKDIETVQTRVDNVQASLSATVGIRDRSLSMLTRDALKSTLSVVAADPVVDRGTPSTRRELPLSDFAKQEKGTSLTLKQLRAFGKSAAERYYQMRGRRPQKREQFVDGTSRLVNTYCTSDVDVLESAWAACVRGNF